MQIAPPSIAEAFNRAISNNHFDFISFVLYSYLIHPTLEELEEGSSYISGCTTHPNRLAFWRESNDPVIKWY